MGDAPGPPSGRRRWLYHIGIKVGDSLGELRAAKKDLEQAGVTIDGMSDHTVSQSLYLQNPDGNEVELYVDADESVWKNNPAAVLAPIKPLRFWRASLKWQRLKPYEKFSEMIDRHWDGIAAYCKPENKVALGFVEGMNNKIRVMQRRSYGLRDEECLRLKVLTCMLDPI